MAARARQLELEENGFVRSTVFPNAIRDVRRSKGYESLREFVALHGSMNYTRLSKIERGEIVPMPEEMWALSSAFKVPVGTLLVDMTAEGFDREKWVRDHIDGANVKAERSGDFRAMVLGAAMRVERHRRKLATMDMRTFGLPAATVSRIENAERPYQRWEAPIQRGIASFFKLPSISMVMDRANEMFDQGLLDETLIKLFSSKKVAERNNRRMINLLKNFTSDPIANSIFNNISKDGAWESFDLTHSEQDNEPAGADNVEAAIELGGPDAIPIEMEPVAVKPRRGRKPKAEKATPPEPVSVSVPKTRKSKAVAAPVSPPVPQASDDVKEFEVLGTEVFDDGSFLLGKTGRKRRFVGAIGPRAFAIAMVSPVLGPGLPFGSILIVDPDRKIMSGDVVALIDDDNQRCQILSVQDDGKNLTGFSLVADVNEGLRDIKGKYLAKMVAVLS